MKIRVLIFIASVFSCIFSFSQGISINSSGNAPDNSAILDVSSDSKGVLLPRMTTAERNNIAVLCSCTPAEGLQIINTDSKCVEMYINGTWSTVSCPTPCTTPDAAGAISGNSTVCQGSVGAWTVASINNATSYTWAYSGTGTTISGTGNSVIIYFSSSATSGNLIVQGTNACGSGIISTNFPITVNPLPASSGSISGSSSVCDGQSGVSYSISSLTNALGYNWSLPAGAMIASGGNTNSISVDFAVGASSGNIVVYGTNACGNSTPSPNYSVTVNANVVASVSIAADPSGTICPGTSVTFTATPTNGGTHPSYQWKVNGGNVGTDTNFYTSSSLNHNDQVYCVMTSNASCVTGSPATSNTIWISHTYYVGQSTGGGKVFYVGTGCSPVLVSSTTDETLGAEWGCIGVPMGTTTTFGNGQANTTAICAGCATAGIAARLCDELDKNGYQDWYLPSKDEINELYNKKAYVGGFTSTWYWSSSEYSDTNIWIKNFGNGNWANDPKSGGDAVRCIRTN